MQINPVGTLPSSYAPVIAKLSIDQMLVQQLSIMTTGSLMPQGLDDFSVSIHPPVRLDAAAATAAATAMNNADGSPAAGTTAAAVNGTNAHYARAAQGGFDFYL